MLQWARQLDQLLRGERTRAESLEGGRFELPLRRFIAIALALGALYGFFMGWYAIALHWDGDAAHGWKQLLASMVKVPLLFLFTLLVTFPSLYVFNALVGARLSFGAALRLLVAAIVVTLAVAASLGTILGFFTLSTESYSFMVVLNVALLAVAGVVGLAFLLGTLRKLVAPTRGAEPSVADAAPAADSATAVFYIWIIIYALVGAQMGWLLRPFIGHPRAKFEWFRSREGTFFEGLWHHLQQMMGG